MYVCTLALHSTSLEDQLRDCWDTICTALKEVTLTSMFPFLSYFGEYGKDDILQDTLVSITMAVMVIPQGLAYALLAELPVEYVNIYVHAIAYPTHVVPSISCCSIVESSLICFILGFHLFYSFT
jgi:hypothetical protein